MLCQHRLSCLYANNMHNGNVSAYQQLQKSYCKVGPGHDSAKLCRYLTLTLEWIC